MSKINLGEDGVLCLLNSGRWDARLSIDVKKLDKDIPREIVRASKSLVVDRSTIKEFACIVREAQMFVQANSVPHPFKGVNWVPNDRILIVDKGLAKIQAEYLNKRDKLANRISKEREAYKKKYPKYYVESQYPTKEEITRKFYMEWRFFEMETPSKKKLLDTKLWKREQEKSQQLVKEIEEMTLNMFGNIIITRLQKLNEQCESGKTNQGTINSINKLLKQWEDLWAGHVDDTSFRMAINRIKRQMSKTSAERLRNNDDFREAVGRETEKIMGKIKNVPNFSLTRKIDL